MLPVGWLEVPHRAAITAGTGGRGAIPEAGGGRRALDWRASPPMGPAGPVFGDIPLAIFLLRAQNTRG